MYMDISWSLFMSWLYTDVSFDTAEYLCTLCLLVSRCQLTCRFLSLRVAMDMWQQLLDKCGECVFWPPQITTPLLSGFNCNQRALDTHTKFEWNIWRKCRSQRGFGLLFQQQRLIKQNRITLTGRVGPQQKSMWLRLNLTVRLHNRLQTSIEPLLVFLAQCLFVCRQALVECFGGQAEDPQKWLMWPEIL